MRPSESKIQSDIIKYLRENGYFVIRINGGMMGRVSFYYWTPPFIDPFATIPASNISIYTQKNTSGLSDIISFKKGFSPLFIEVKSDTGKLSPMQEVFLEFAKEFGTAMIARSVNDVDGAIGKCEHIGAGGRQGNRMPARVERLRYWDFFIANLYLHGDDWGSWAAPAGLREVKDHVISDDELWHQITSTNGIEDINSDDAGDSENLKDCVACFWAMVYGKMCDMKIIKM